MNERMLDPTIRRSANEAWYVSGRASQKDRYGQCLEMLVSGGRRIGLAYDIGAGTGHFARILAAHAREVLGVERLPERAAACREGSADTPNVRFLAGDFLELDIPEGEADAVCALEMLYYVNRDDWDRFFDKIHRTLRPGGLLLASVNIFHHDETDREAELLHAVETRFERLDLRYMRRLHYYKLELPLIRLLDEIAYLERIKTFYPHTVAAGYTVYSPRLDNLLLPPSFILDRMALPACKRLVLGLLGSTAVYRMVTAISRLLAPKASRSQALVLARRPDGE